LQQNDPEHWLTPEQDSLTEMLELIDHFDNDFKANLDRYKYPTRYSDADPAVNRERASESLLQLDQRLSADRFLFGKHTALADMAIMPFVRQFASVSRDWFAAQSWKRLQAWLRLIEQSAQFARIMQPVPPWVPGTQGVRFPFETHD
jgi:glutathione S-transferase